MDTRPPTKGRESDPQPIKPTNNGTNVFPFFNIILLMTNCPWFLQTQFKSKKDPIPTDFI
jgi:hypothetical protein